MIRTREYKVFIQQNLRESETFMITYDDDDFTIQKDQGRFLFSPYFKCIIVANYTDDIVNLFIDKISYNYFTKELDLMNTRNHEDKICSKLFIKDRDTASLYTFGSEGILIVINREEK